MTQAQIQILVRLMRRHPRAAVLLFIVFAFIAGLEYFYATSPPHRIAALIHPAKLARLGERAANPRVQKYVAVLEEAQRSGKLGLRSRRRRRRKRGGMRWRARCRPNV
jgi:hypothetical protein